MEAGIDEAGRGPVMGPLVVAGVAVADPGLLAAMGCRDSKLLTPARRGRLARLLWDDPGVAVAVRVVPPEVLDTEMATGTLNDAAMRRFQQVALELGAPRVVADAADVDPVRFGNVLASVLPQGAQVVAEHHADGRHPTVMAASIIAKVVRDAEVAALARRLERRLEMPLGSGYPSDQRTRAFLAAWVERNGDLPEGARRAWKTSKDLLRPAPATLDRFQAGPPQPL